MKDPLEYPFDSAALTRGGRALKTALLEAVGSCGRPCRIAVLGSSTTSTLVGFLELFLLKRGVVPSFYESAFGRWHEEAVFGSEGLDGFNPEIVFVATTSRAIRVWPEVGASKDEVDALYSETCARFERTWESLSSRFRCPVIQNGFDMPFCRLYGNRDAVESCGRVRFVNRLNAFVADHAAAHAGFHLNDLAWQCADLGLSRWYDERSWHLFREPVSRDAAVRIAFNAANVIAAAFGLSRKAIAVDLDGTLWGGVIGEVGPDGIEVGPDSPAGEAHADFQRYLKGLEKRGVPLVVLSKNDAAIAEKGLSRPGMVLGKDDFAAQRVNWGTKSANLRSAAEELNLSPEAFVFLDDMPEQRAEVASVFPSVLAPELGEVEDFIFALDRTGAFEPVAVSVEDASRAEMYRANVRRAAFRRETGDFDAYLESLDQHALIRSLAAPDMERVAQLFAKCNQFNLTGVRFAYAELARRAEDARSFVLTARLSDRFGDNGLVSAIVSETLDETLEIVSWVMSCRVFQRGLEHAMMDALVGVARERGLRALVGRYRPTDRNRVVAALYEGFGFVRQAVGDAGEAVFRLDLAKPISPFNRFVHVDGDNV